MRDDRSFEIYSDEMKVSLLVLNPHRHDTRTLGRTSMLALSRKVGETIVIGGDIRRVRDRDPRSGGVRVAIDAPGEMSSS